MAGARKLGVIAGGGELPFRILHACEARGEAAFFVKLKGSADAALSAHEETECGAGEIGRIIEALKAAGCTDITFAGYVARPDLSNFKVDWRGARLLPKLIAASRNGDAALLRVLTEEAEREGLKVIGAGVAAGELVAPAGALTKAAPCGRDQEDIAKAQELLAALGPFDVGQGAVIADGYVLAIEAAEGTDAMLERCARLATLESGRAGCGVLVKQPKPGQDLRIDLPVIGPKTVRLAAAAGLSGIALAAGKALIIDREDTVRAADAAGLFIYGFAGREHGGG